MFAFKFTRKPAWSALKKPCFNGNGGDEPVLLDCFCCFLQDAVHAKKGGRWFCNLYQQRLVWKAYLSLSIVVVLTVCWFCFIQNSHLIVEQWFTVCIDPLCSLCDTNLSHYAFISFLIPLLSDCLNFIIGDFNRAPTYLLIIFSLVDFCFILTR